MNFKVIVHRAEEGGFWAEVPAILGCATQGESMTELIANVREAIDACLSVDLTSFDMTENDEIFELAV
jgi:predicted RNase H-like HicB family nuclease